MTAEEFFDSLHQQFIAQLPFVVYNALNSQKIKAALQKDNTLFSTTDFKENGFVFAPFNDLKKTILLPKGHSNCYEINQPVNYKYQSNAVESNTSNSDKLIHMQLVQKGIEAIKNNDLRKVVLSRKETVKCSVSNPIDLFRQLLSAYPKAFVYCWYHPKVGLWLGATPETLIKVKGNRFSTMALAGTQMYDGSLEVTWNEKELDEQKIVTDYLVQQLEPITANLQTTEVQTVKAANVLHLKTDVLGTIDKSKIGLVEILNALHPTPAVSGFPKDKAKEFILEHEDYNREYYTGFLGEINSKETVTRNSNRRNVENSAYGAINEVSNLYVNLRCMQVQGDLIHIYIGGGITKDSIPEDEWYETVNKTMTIKNCL